MRSVKGQINKVGQPLAQVTLQPLAQVTLRHWKKNTERDQY